MANSAAKGAVGAPFTVDIEHGKTAPTLGEREALVDIELACTSQRGAVAVQAWAAFARADS